jgi:hypothetical protein
MNLKNALRVLFAPENPAITAYEALAKRVDVCEEAIAELADGQEDVINKVRSWSAREAARKRHDASRNLDEIMAANGSRDGENGDPEASSGQADPEAISMQRINDERAARKAAIARQFRRG